MSNRCKACGAEILFLQTKQGKYMPVDVNPPPDKEQVPIETPFGVVHKVPHFATCPHADNFRKGLPKEGRADK